ncbi:MAG TPA: DUF2267 domain-containing protein [Actinomycetes bacterium]|nr:DUF2267 domain-containing protein [Actinomycetes bacterium]
MTGHRSRLAVRRGGGWMSGLAHQLRHEGVHARRVLLRRGRHLHDVWEGARYRLSRSGPDPLVDDDVLADRVRSALGVVAKQLDVPRAHVMVTSHVVTLHGEVGTLGEALTLAGAAGAVPGVLGVQSRLHVGLLPGQHRPSQDRMARRPAAPALRYLLAVAARAGVGADHAPAAVHAVLESFAGCLQAGERRRLLGCLPADVRRLAQSGRRRSPRIDDPVDLVARVAEVSGLGDMVRAERVTEAVLGALHEVLPAARAVHLGTALPPGLRPLWRLAGQRAGSGGWPIRRRQGWWSQPHTGVRTSAVRIRGVSAPRRSPAGRVGAAPAPGSRPCGTAPGRR